MANNNRNIHNIQSCLLPIQKPLRLIRRRDDARLRRTWSVLLNPNSTKTLSVFENLALGISDTDCFNEEGGRFRFFASTLTTPCHAAENKDAACGTGVTSALEILADMEFKERDECDQGACVSN